MKLKDIEELMSRKDSIDKEEFRTAIKSFLKENVTENHIEDYNGEYPSIIEPVVLGKEVKIGDDVLLGPNVFIGDNVEIGDYDEISNSIIMDETKLGEIFKLDYCVVDKGSKLSFNNVNLRNCILSGKTDSKKKVNKKCFKS
jgi:NDP-sugar pyrophosphorylase family protein